MSIEVKNLTFVYGKKTPFEKKAIDDVTFTIKGGEFVGIVGCTGSGKSTLIQHFNGLVKLQIGSMRVCDIDLAAKKINYKQLRSGIGMLFQYPEYQLFDSTVLKDVCFGAKNFGMTDEQAEKEARHALEMVGLDFEEIKERSPFELSGGQKRRVAMAGVLVYHPKILILDEPTAGLDPLGKKEMLDLITRLKKNGEIDTVIMISHNMDEIAAYTDRILLLHNSKLIYDLPTSRFFAEVSDLTSLGLEEPSSVKIKRLLAERGIDIDTSGLTADSLTEGLVAALKKKGVSSGAEVTE